MAYGNVSTKSFVNAQRELNSCYELAQHFDMPIAYVRSRMNQLEKLARSQGIYNFFKSYNDREGIRRGRRSLRSTMANLGEYVEPVIADEQMSEELAEIKSHATV